MIRLILMTVGLALYSLTSYAESDSVRHKERISRIVKRIEKQESLLLNYNLTGTNKRLANKLSKEAYNSDLILLTENTNPTVFCIAYLILAKRNDSFVDSFYLEYSNMSEAEWIAWTKLINRVNRKHVSDVVILYTNSSLVEDVKGSGKFLDQIRRSHSPMCICNLNLINYF